jgi:epoxyqueuosine reductase
MTAENFRDTFRGSPVTRTKLSGLRRNAVVAMGNSKDRRFLPKLQQLANDPDPLVAEHAHWALRQLQPLHEDNSLTPVRTVIE